MPYPSKTKKRDERPDSWKRLERAVDAALKTFPTHREKSKPKKHKSRCSLAKATIIIFGLLGAGNYASADTLNLTEYKKLGASISKLIQLDKDINESLMAAARQEMARGAGASSGLVATNICLLRVSTYMDITREWLHVVLATWGVTVYLLGSPNKVFADNDIEKYRQYLKDTLAKARSEINAVQGTCRNNQLVMTKANAVLALITEIQDQMTQIDHRLMSERMLHK